VAREGERNHRALDRARLAESQIANAFEEPGIEIQGGESNRRGVAGRGFECRRL
jgi:hypothetical protein